MKRIHLGILPKMTLILVLFAALLLVMLSWLAYRDVRNAIETATVTELFSIAIEKQDALNDWIEETKTYTSAISASPNLREIVDDLVAANTAGDQAGVQAARDGMVAELLDWTGEGRDYLAWMLLDAQSGQILASTESDDEGKFKENRQYFIQGKQAVYVQNVYYGSVGLAMTVAAPIRSEDGRLLAVLAGRLDLKGLNDIVRRRTGLRQSDDVFLVNTSHLFVTQPRFVSDPAVLQRGIHTRAVDRCLERNSGVIQDKDYRGVSSFIVYRWLPERQLCMIVKIDQAEAIAPAQAFGRTVSIFSGLVLLAAALLALGLARAITRPVLELARGAREIGSGNLGVRLPVRNPDEIGHLAEAFNQMAVDLQQSLGETAHGHRTLQALSQAAQTVQRAHTPEEVYDAVSHEVISLGHHAVIFGLAPDRSSLTIKHLTFESDLLRMAEDLAGLSVRDYHQPLRTGDFYDQALKGGVAVFLGNILEPLNISLPFAARPLAGRILSMLGLKQCIYVPLMIAGEAEGILFVFGDQLTEADLPAVSLFANQTAIALENTRLYQETRAWADELEQRVEARATALRESEERFRSTFEQAAVGVTQVTPEGNFIRCNQRFSEIVGYSREELSSLRFQDITYPEDLETDLENVRKMLTDEIQKFKMEKRYIRKDGNLVWVNMTVSLVREPTGEPKYFISVIEDISQRKQVEAELQLKNVELERSNRELEQFAYVASHDLQEPLRMVSSYVQLLQQRYQEKLDAEADEFIAFAVDGATRMQRLINDLLSFSRVGTRGKDFTNFSCEDVLDAALANLEAAIQDSNAVITHDPLPTVVGDETQLVQLFQNLIGNALKFHGRESPRIHVSARKTSEVSKTSGTWEFSVRDNGIGIQPNQLDRIFVIFQRLHGRSEYPGTGIGLAICKKIVERHGGRIWVESEPGKGSTFYFTLSVRGNE